MKKLWFLACCVILGVTIAGTISHAAEAGKKPRWGLEDGI